MSIGDAPRSSGRNIALEDGVFVNRAQHCTGVGEEGFINSARHHIVHGTTVEGVPTVISMIVGAYRISREVLHALFHDEVKL